MKWPFQRKRPFCAHEGHRWIYTAIHNHDHSCDFGAGGPWDGAYARFCTSCRKWEAEVDGTAVYGDPQMVAHVDQPSLEMIDPEVWYRIEDFRKECP